MVCIGNLGTISLSCNHVIRAIFRSLFLTPHLWLHSYHSYWRGTDQLFLFQVLESALARMLEGRHISDAVSDCFGTDYPEIHAKFWGQLQMLLKKMLSLALSANANKPTAFAQPTPTSSKFGDAAKLRELYKMSLKSSNLSQLHAMHTLWTS